MSTPHVAHEARRLRSLAVLGAVLAMALAGCVSLPESGSVRTGPAQDQVNQDAPVDYKPPGPQPGSTPVAIVNGFLDAMLATPLKTFVARQFLTTESSSRWVPEKSTVVFGQDTLSSSGRAVTMRLQSTVQLDGRGQWLGDPSHGNGVSYTLDLVRERGEWRISNPPDALIIPQTHFETRYQQYFLYFFDKSAQTLVPEPVYLPRGDQAPTLLVAGLLRGPDQGLLGVERTFIPAKTELDDLSVPISRDGAAQVPLSDEVLDMSDDDLNLALAQLAWTLRQVPGVERMRITVDGSPLDLPGQNGDANVDDWSEFDPAVDWASRELFGIRDGRVVTLDANDERRISGVFGSLTYGLRTIAVDLPAERVAGVTGAGTKVVVAPRARPAESQPSPANVRTVYAGGTDVLKPAWDLHGQLWLLDRTTAGAVLSVVRSSAAQPLNAPGISGQNVRAFVVSRDGTRLVAVLADRGGDRLVIARILRDGQGRVRRVAGAVPLPVANPAVAEIRDLGWSTPGSVAVLAGPTPSTSRVVVARVDGSSVQGDASTNAELFRANATGIVTAPALGSPLYVDAAGQLYQLAANGRWTGTSIEPGLVSPTFVG